MTILEQIKEYKTLTSLSPMIEYKTRRDGETVKVIQAQESIRYNDGTFERITIELPVIQEVA